VFGCDSRSPTPESGIVGDKGLAEVGVRRDCSAWAGMLAKSEYGVVQQADWLHSGADDATLTR
jgi:hypothetical protein